MPPTFKHSSLQSPTQIRLISFPPESKAPGFSICGVAPVECSLITVDLAHEAAPEFDALSYTWGNPHPEVPPRWYDSGPHDEYKQRDGDYSATNKWPVSIDGKLLWVTKNLYYGLLELQARPVPLHAVANSKVVEGRDPQYNKTDLIRSSEQGKLERVKMLLREGCDVGNVDKYGETPLHYAAENGHFEVVQILVQAGSDIHRRDLKGRTPLNCAEQRKRRDWTRVSEYLQAERQLQERRPLWIDAVCIDQENVLERNAQVAIMSQIYSSASRVIVWLGIEDRYTKLAVDTMSLINSTPQGDHETWRRISEASLLGADKEKESFNMDETTRRYNAGFRALLALINRSWFKRVWVIQEITWASKLVLICGSHRFSWDDLFQVVQRQYHPCEDHVCNGQRLLSYKFSPALKYNTQNRGSEARSLTEIRLRTRPDIPEQHYVNNIIKRQGSTEKHTFTWSSRMRLPVLLSYTWNFHATDLKDKIFALKSFVKSEDQEEIEIDYFRSVEDVFTTTAPIFLRGSDQDILQDLVTGECEGLEPLEGLSFIQNNHGSRQQRNSNLPSWVPHFGLKLVTSRIFSQRFHASTQSPHNLIFEGNVFTVWGSKFDQIVDMGPEESISEGSGISFTIEDWLRLASTLEPNFAATGQNRAEVLWRTLILDDIGSFSHEDMKRSFREFMASDEQIELYHSRRARDLYETLRKTDDSNSLSELNKDLDVKGDPEKAPKVWQFKPAISFAPGGTFARKWPTSYGARRLFTTAKGYLGLGPGALENGDHVVLFAGARTPFVIRPVEAGNEERGFTFIGEIYVHGIMQGEAMEGREDTFGPIKLV